MYNLKPQNILKYFFLSFFFSFATQLFAGQTKTKNSIKNLSPEKESTKKIQKPKKRDPEAEKKEKIKNETNNLLSKSNSLHGEKIILQQQFANNNTAINDMNKLVSENENLLTTATQEVKKTESILSQLKEERNQMPKKKERIGREIAKIKKDLLAADSSNNRDSVKSLSQKLQSKLASFQEIKIAITRNTAEVEKIAISLTEKQQAKRNIENNIKNYKNEIFRLKKENNQIQRQIESINKKIVETKDKIMENDFKLNLNSVEM